jgi:hypothetical protein
MQAVLAFERSFGALRQPQDDNVGAPSGLVAIAAMRALNRCRAEARPSEPESEKCQLGGGFLELGDSILGNLYEYAIPNWPDTSGTGIDLA